MIAIKAQGPGSPIVLLYGVTPPTQSGSEWSGARVQASGLASRQRVVIPDMQERGDCFVLRPTELESDRADHEQVRHVWQIGDAVRANRSVSSNVSANFSGVDGPFD